MFEQSLYQFRPDQSVEETPDLFEHYEIRNWDLGPRVIKILAISAIFNVFALLVVAQTSLLTMKGCDSPLVGRVCSVLDVVYVSSMMFGTDREMVDAAYDPTRIDDDAEITFVDVTGVAPPLSYPEGYFQLANPEQFAMSQDPSMAFDGTLPDIDLGAIPMPAPSTSGDLMNTPQVLPQPNPNVVTGELPTFGNDSPSTYKPPRPVRTPRIKNAVPDIDDNDVAVVKPTPSPSPEVLPTPMSSDQVNSVEINKKPLVDFADDVAVKWAANEVDISKDFQVVLNGVLAADGSLDLKASKFDVAQQKGDQKMIDVGKAALEALGKSGYLTYLKSLNVDKFTAKLVQDENNVTVIISSAQKTPELAKTIASGLNSYIMFGKIRVENPSDERTLLDGAKVTAEGKNFVLNFVVPKPIAQEMINRKLKEAQAKKAQQPKPNGNLPGRSGDANAAK